MEFSVKSGSSKAKSLTIPLDKKNIQIGPIKVAIYSLLINYLPDVLFVQIECVPQKLHNDMCNFDNKQPNKACNKLVDIIMSL